MVTCVSSAASSSSSSATATRTPIPTQLCLACASSPLPRADKPPFRTPCCGRPICARCLNANPRLGRYDPCLACLSGVAATGGSRNSNDPAVKREPNVDGGLRDADLFVLGLDEDDSDSDEQPPPAYESPERPCTDSHSTTPLGTTLLPGEHDRVPATVSNPGPSIPHPTSGQHHHHLQPTDTLAGLALRYRIPPRELCALNNLPLSTLTTTPALLHTRRSIRIARADGTLAGKRSDADRDAVPLSEEERARAHARRREKAEKRLQVLAKETDWRVARAYVALAEDGDHDDGAVPSKEGEDKAQLPPGERGWEARAAAAYLDDAEWEAHAPAPRRDAAGWITGAV
jgi:hypothetical protein